MQQVFLIRHPKPDIAPGICYGNSDIQPNANALQSAFIWLDALLPKPIKIISSPLTRCAQLAMRLGGQAPRSCEFDLRLAERNCGAWELQAWDQVPRAELDAWAENFIDYAAPGAESVRQMQTRVLAAWADYAACPTLAVVSHAGPIQVLLTHLAGAQLSATPIMDIPCGAAVLLTKKQSRWEFSRLAC